MHLKSPKHILFFNFGSRIGRRSSGPLGRLRNRRGRLHHGAARPGARPGLPRGPDRAPADRRLQ